MGHVNMNHNREHIVACGREANGETRDEIRTWLELCWRIFIRRAESMDRHIVLVADEMDSDN